MKQLFTKHWEKVALVASILILLAYGIVNASTKKPGIIGDATRTTQDLDSILTNKEVPLPDKPKSEEHIKNSYKQAVEATPGEEWVFNRKPDIKVEAKIVTGTTTTTSRVDKKVFKNPVLGAPAVEPGTVKLTWTDNPDNKGVVMSGYVVFRKAPGGKDFEKLTADPIKELAYTDTAVDPKKEYQYAVLAITDDKDVTTKELRSDPKSVTTVGILDLEMKGVAEIPLEEGQPPVPTAQVNVKKFVDGKWKTKLYLIRKGDKIGEGDLATRYEVMELARVTIPRVIEYTVDKYDKTGAKIGSEKKQVTREMQVWELKYKDEDGKIQKLYPSAPTSAPPSTPPATPPATATPAPGPAAPKPPVK